MVSGEHFWLSQQGVGWGWATGIWWIKVRGAAKHTAMHRRTSHKEFSGPSGVKVEKPELNNGC